MKNKNYNGKAWCVPIVVLGAPVGTERYQEVIHTCMPIHSHQIYTIHSCTIHNAIRKLSIHAPIYYQINPHFHHEHHWTIGIKT